MRRMGISTWASLGKLTQEVTLENTFRDEKGLAVWRRVDGEWTERINWHI